ncbi:MAG: MMPL family transporter [Clostridia bacterium]|nr:MMPL family transporter [Clostridia bacterium]
MNRMADWILTHRRIVLILLAITAAASAFLMTKVNVNYSLSDYLPEDAPSTKALNVMNEAFDASVPNTNIFVPNVSIPQALKIKEQIQALNGVTDVMWLDTVMDIETPLAFADEETVSAWYKDGAALFMATVDVKNPHIGDLMATIRQIGGEGTMLSGEAVNQAAVQSTTMGEVGQIMYYVVPLVLIILLVSTSSWLEPILFLITIGIAILINEGTNVFLGSISYVTQATSAILQLAVSMDYAVFLLHSFARHRADADVPSLSQAMKRAMVESSSSIAASAMTTVFGFLALLLMGFRIGPDMGVVLAKGVFISFLSVLILLPVMALSVSKLLDKTKHRSFLPSFKGLGRAVAKICLPIGAVILVALLPAYLGQQNNQFLYGSSGMHAEGSLITEEQALINEKFNVPEQMILMVPDTDVVREEQLANALGKIDRVTSVTCFANTVGAEIPANILSASDLSQFRGGGYSRLILTAAVPAESEASFRLVEQLRATANQYYPGEAHLLGQCAVNYDLKETITGDNLKVFFASIGAIGVILLLTFRQITVPLILLLSIEGAIWINLCLPYFAGSSLNYIGYQIISSVQLGATVDYGILFCERYLHFRRSSKPKKALAQTVSATAGSIITPALILFIAGTVLGYISSNGIISQLGAILGRGAAISTGMVMLFLPALLRVFDRFVYRPSRKNKEAIE